MSMTETFCTDDELRMTKCPNRLIGAYRRAWSMRRDHIDMEVEHIAGLDRLDVVGIILILVAAAEERVAVVIAVGNFYGILDRTGWICFDH